MSDILFPRKLATGVVGRPQVTNATSAITGTLMNLPPGYLDEGVGSLIKALVISQNPRGLATLETDKGLLSLQTNHPLKAGARLTLQLQSTGAQTRIVILAIENAPTAHQGPDSAPSVGGAPTHQAAKGAPTPAANASSVARGTDTLAVRSSLPGTPASVSEAGQTQTAGALARDHHFMPPDPIRPGLVLPATVISVSDNGVAHAGQGPALSAGDKLIVRILGIGDSVAKPGATPPQPTLKPNLELRAVVAEVAGQDSAPPPRGNHNSPPHLHRQQTVLATPTARIALAASPPGPAGMDVSLEVLDFRPPAPVDGKATQKEIADFIKLATDWKSIKDVSALSSNEPGAIAASATPGVIPRPGATMASSMLFFIAALKVGDVGAWLGTKTVERLIEQGHHNLISRLSADFAIVARHSSEGFPNGWHALAIPVNFDHQSGQVRMYYRRNSRPSGAEDADSSTRFIVEAELSRFGLFQMDGLIKKTRFDLIIRTHSDLNAGIQADIRNIFTEALSLGVLAGTLQFNAGLAMPFSPADGEPKAYLHGDGVLV